MNPDQTAFKGAVCSGSVLFAILTIPVKILPGQVLAFNTCNDIKTVTLISWRLWVVKLVQGIILDYISPDMSHCMGFPTMWYLGPAKPQISLRVRAV